MPDLGQADLNRIPPELREPLEHMFSLYGKENVVSLAMGKWAEEYGYKPYEQAKADIRKQIIREILIEEFTKDMNGAIKKYMPYLEQMQLNGMMEDIQSI